MVDSDSAARDRALRGLSNFCRRALLYRSGEIEMRITAFILPLTLALVGYIVSSLCHESAARIALSAGAGAVAGFFMHRALCQIKQRL
jgi:hypothetical protein